MSYPAQKTAMWSAAIGLLVVVGGCVGRPFGPALGPNGFATPGAAMLHATNSTRPVHNPSLSPATSTPAVHPPTMENGPSPGLVTRGQNATGYPNDGAGQLELPFHGSSFGPNTPPARDVRSGDYVHGPMKAWDAPARDSSFMTAGSPPSPAPRTQATNPYPVASAGYHTQGNGFTPGGVRPVQYETVQPGQPGGAAAPGNPQWLENGAPGITVPYTEPVWSESVIDPVPRDYADMIATVQETHTGQFMFGVGINSDAGLTGQITIQERNFDIFRPPTSWEDFANGTAWRGGGQNFRLEALPGTHVQRYTVQLGEPYLFGTDISLNVSGFYYDRLYFDWDERRYGGRLSFGYRLTPDLSVSTALRAENVDIRNPRVTGVPELDDALGNHDLFSGRISVAHDRRDRYFAPTAGHFVEMSFEQVFGDYDYSRADVDFRKYFLIRERPDTSGRHTLALNVSAGFTGADTPIFENYFAGGYSTIRGFNFRGASPKDVPTGVILGGRFRFLASAEYMFPITADDMLRMVAFCDVGTVEQEIEMRSENFRVAPGFGLRIFVPAMGPAPIALDFAFPVAKSPFDDTQMFSFFVGIGR